MHATGPVLRVPTYDAAVAFFEQGAGRWLTFLSPSEVHAWAERTAKRYIAKRLLVVCEPLPW